MPRSAKSGPRPRIINKNSLAYALREFTRQRFGDTAQHDVAEAMRVTQQYVSMIFSGRKPLTVRQVNRVLDVCKADADTRKRFNQFGAREAGWKL